MLLPLLMNNLMSVPAIPAAGTPIIIKSTISIGDALPSGIDAYNVFKSEIEQADLISGINLSMKGKSNIIEQADLVSGINLSMKEKSNIIEQADLVSGINLSMKEKSNITTNIP